MTLVLIYVFLLAGCFNSLTQALFNELPLQDRVQSRPAPDRLIFPENSRSIRQANDGNCDATVVEEEGWFFSPNYPSNYDNQQSCNFVISRWRRDACEIQLTLMDFDLDDSNGCFGDYLDISEGSPPVPGGGKLCGSLATGTKKTLTFPRGRDSLVLKFQSDGAQTRKGFMIKVNQIANTCSRRQEPPFDNDFGGVQCDQTISGYESVLNSPGYPNRYPKETRCRYVLRRPDASVCRVELDFIRFEVEYSPGCRNDYLELPGGNRLCGNVVSPSVLEYPGALNSLTLVFSSDVRGTGPGFEVAIRQIPNSCGRNQPRPVPPRPGPSDDCDRLLTGPRDRVSFRTDPNPYGSRGPRRCRFVVQRYRPNVCRVVLTLDRFRLDPGDRDCLREYLQLPDGTRLCGSLSGRKTLVFPRGGRHLTLEYVIDQAGYGLNRGFDLMFDQTQGSCDDWLDSFCDQDLPGYEARVTSPGFPSEYGPNQRCSYNIRRADSTVCVLSVDFYFFDLERGQSGKCDQDSLEMPDGSRLCGIVAGEKLYKFPAGSATLSMTFSSDHYGKGKGFELRLRQRPNSCDNPAPTRCDQTISSESEVIRSPGYPSNYPSSVRCLYTIQRLMPDTCQVRMDFLDFDMDGGAALCTQDYLEVEATGERICGRNVRNSRLLTFPTNSDSMLLVLKTDAVRSRKGFEIRLTQVRSSCYRGAVDPDRVPVCGTVREYAGVFQSENHPLSYASNKECTYRVMRASSDVCRIEFYLARFDVGTGSDSLCLGDYVEISGARYCGRRDRQTVRVDFPEGQNELNIRFRSDGYGQHSGFRIDVRQLTTGCNDRTPINKNCGSTYSEDSFDLISPGFQNGSYPSNEDCRYIVRKVHNEVCALEVRYNVFDLQDSQDCDRDFLEISEQKICGKLPFDSTRTYEFSEDTLTIRFRSDQRETGAGFFLSVKQKEC